ncbi:DUF4198 domain-containing protein [Sphingomonas sp. MMS12-HWE2-04]|uniref:DUF4198 domain-containing protein n=1 Tax=Sphingomonas sp. MMS12-HWE2-04 TaxID=3234199 RepID=UPI00384D4979
MNLRTPLLAVAAVAALAAPAAFAHRMWMIASSTSVSGTDNWVTVDAAVSNDLFFFDHQPIRAVPSVTQPDGTEGTVENHAVGKFRATFDVHLTQQGTYRIGGVSQAVFGNYKLNGETKMLPRGTTPATLAAAIPAGATDVQTAESVTRNEIYVTQGAPTTTVFKPSGKGIELVPVTHPNDLVVGEAATFQFLLDGKPAPNLFVTVIPGGIRYRDALKQQDLKTGPDGKVSINWPDPGLYWVNVTPNRPREEGPGEGAPRGPGGPGGPAAGAPGAGGPAGPGGRMSGPPQRRVSYVTTLEVLAP